MLSLPTMCQIVSCVYILFPNLKSRTAFYYMKIWMSGCQQLLALIFLLLQKCIGDITLVSTGWRGLWNILIVLLFELSYGFQSCQHSEYGMVTGQLRKVWVLQDCSNCLRMVSNTDPVLLFLFVSFSLCLFYARLVTTIVDEISKHCQGAYSIW